MRWLLFLALGLPLAAQETLLPLADPGFEAGAEGWSLGNAMASVSEEQAASGRRSLKIVDDSETEGSNAVARRVTIDGAGSYLLRGQAYPVQGAGLGIYVKIYDADGKLIGRGDEFQRAAPSEPIRTWREFRLPIYTAPGARFLEVWVHSYNAAKLTAYLDDFELVQLSAGETAPPLWPPLYKIRPDETDRLTAADVVGPDGLVYPNWARAGVPGGIPEVPVAVRAADYGMVPDDEGDDAVALQRAIDAAAAAGGGAILLAPGTFYLDHLISIRTNGVVIRGAGAERTRLRVRYSPGPDGIRWAETAGDTLYPDSQITVHTRPEKLEQLEIFAGGKSVARYTPSTHSGNTFSLTVSGSRIQREVPADATETTLRAVATHAGRTSEIERTITITRRGDDPRDDRRAPSEAAISFSGDSRWWKAKQIKLTADGKRGETAVELESVEGLAVGDWLMIEGPATERWKRLTRNECQWGSYRNNLVQITGLDGNRVSLGEALRIEYPIIDESKVYKVDLITGCGIEDLAIEQLENLWITTVLFQSAQGCWARAVTVKNCGRNPVYASDAEQCTITDCVFDDAWFKGGGGTAYAGWERSFDCLMENTTTYRLRHAPLFQWSAAGNVIRASRFVDSDLQWHSGWTNENLVEQCEVIATPGNGAYGFGAWASPPEDTAHGPNGPRNVLYNCDLWSPKTGLWMGGMNENWLILYNRFRVDSGQGVFTKTYSFDHIIRGNVFALKQDGSPALLLATPDASGVEFYENTIYGGGATVAGLGTPGLERDNRRLPYQPDPPRPTPPVESIYRWQLAQLGR